MIKAILFDLDNTLIDFMRFKEVSCRAAVDAMINAGLKMSKEEALKKLYDTYMKEGFEDQKIFQKFLQEINGEIDKKILSYAILAYRHAKTDVMQPYPNTESTLIRLKEKGLKLAIVSDAPELQAWLRLCSVKLDSFFDVVVSLEDTGKLKPHNLPFKRALELLDVNAEDCIMIGDNSERDIKGAKELGIRTVLAKYGSLTDSHIKADYEIDNIEDLVGVIENINKS